MSIPYTIVNDGVNTVVTALVDGTPYVADKSHPNYVRIMWALESGSDDVVSLFDVAASIKESYESLSERVSISNGRVYFDGDEVDNSVTKQIVRFLESGLEPNAMVAFMENLAQNPNSHSREQLSVWLSRHDFTITADGHFIAYKGVAVFGDKYQSISSGTAVVNGETQKGQIPQGIGDVVTMPRSNVAFDPGVGCSYGLHAGTWAYASDFGRGAVLTVKINPRDVVSVPTDCDSQKLRVCRYEIINVTEQEYLQPLFDDVDEDDDVDDDNFGWSHRHAFDSTLIDVAWFDMDADTIYIKFVATDKVFAYTCTPDVWDGFVTTVSPGRYFNEFIRNEGNVYAGTTHELGLV